ncbi:MAG: nicotinate-nucleotide adenylyltransferase [Gammaproteobacteria bacterium]|jgi:nicotinate-nucleotide adenylyltransferase
MDNLTPIGILGGTFDPIHLGHIKIAEYALKKCNLQKVIFIPCHTPAHRYQPIATAAQRLTMTQLAIKDYPNFIADDREIKRQGTSFMIDTLQSLKKDYPNNSLCLILGTDAFANLDTWHQWQQLTNYANFIVINRLGVKIEISSSIKELLKNSEIFDPTAFQHKPNGLIYQLHITPIPISATKIRKQLHEHKLPTDSLPKAVYDYIYAEKIYGYQI